MITARRVVLQLRSKAREFQECIPGLLIAVTISCAAAFVSNAHGGPTILFALLLGMSFNFISNEARFSPGLQFAARSILRTGVALLGARITADQITALGWMTLAVTVAAVAFTIAFGVAVASLLGLKSRLGILTAGAVAICGASAAAAIAAVLPKTAEQERDTSFTIIGVTTLSTVCMVLYPAVTNLFHLSHVQTGVFLGGTIHDVAQVVGAGYSVSPETGDVATIVKLMRVSLLLPVVITISFFSRRLQTSVAASSPPLLPLFLVVFFVIVLANSFHVLIPPVQTAMNEVSRWCIIVAIAALGVKTSIADMTQVGFRSIVLLVVETAFIAIFVLTFIHVG